MSDESGKAPRIVPRPKLWDEQYNSETPQQRRNRRWRLLGIILLLAILLANLGYCLQVWH